MNYYNEWDKGAAAWLRELIKQGHIPYGYVDERSISEVRPQDLEGFTQCHFFAGIGGWSRALNLACVRPDQRLWTGSPPCQPFSVAGKQLGQLDERHLAPTFMRLVEQCRPPILFGEQVAAAIGKHWLDDLFTELERQDYACGSAVLPACSVGAPHKRDRLFFGATLQLGNAESLGKCTDQLGSNSRDGVELEGAESRFDGKYRCTDVRMAYAASPRHMRGETAEVEAGQQPKSEHTRELSARFSGRTIPDIQQGSRMGSVADADNPGLERREGVQERTSEQSAWSSGLDSGSTSPDNGFWSGADWLGCRDGKIRPVESGTFPLANGIPARVGRLRGYGNAIVPQVAAEFITAFMESI